MTSLTGGSRGTPSPSRPERWPVAWLLVANLISNLGNGITTIAIPLFVLLTTGSAGQVGLVAAAPMVLSTFVGGTLADRMSHRQLAVLSDVLSGATVAAIPALYLTVGLSLEILIALVFLGAIFDGPGMNARQAMIPKLSERAGMSLERVNSGFGIGRSLMSLVGAPAAGLLVAWLGSAHALWITAGTFAVSATIVRLLVPATGRPEPSGDSMLADMKAGLAFLFQSRLLRSIALTATVLNMVLSPVITIGMPVYITDQGHGAGTLGLLMTAFAAGALTGSLFYAWLGERLPPRLTLIVALVLICGPLYGVAMQPGLWVMWVLLFALDFGSGIVNPLVLTFFQRYTPEHLLGRTLGTLTATALMASPLALLIGGALIGSQGLGMATLVGTLAMTAVSVLLAFSGALAELGRPEPQAA